MIKWNTTGWFREWNIGEFNSQLGYMSKYTRQELAEFILILERMRLYS